jgi:hypothetical protein
MTSISQFYERVEEEAMDPVYLEEGRLYGIKSENKVGFGRFMCKFGGTAKKTQKKITEELLTIINTEEIYIKNNKIYGKKYVNKLVINKLLTEIYYRDYKHYVLYQFEWVEEKNPFSSIYLLKRDLFTRYLKDGFCNGRSNYTFHELLPAVGMFKNAAATVDDDDA